jgi:hypothetical protein
MPKTTKPERKALFALEDAAAAARFAKQAAKTLPAKQAKKLRELAKDAEKASDASKKAIRTRPKKVAKRADKATDRALTAAETALDRRQKKAADAARKQAAERKAAEKKARTAAEKKARRAAEKAERKTAADRKAVPNVVEVTERQTPPAVDPATVETSTQPAPVSDSVEQPADTPLPRPVSSLTVAALRSLARDQGRTGYSRLTKAQLVELLS